MSIGVESIVIEKKDPIRHVGIIEGTKGKKAYVRWHAGYASWVLLADLEVAPEGKEMGDRLGPRT